MPIIAPFGLKGINAGFGGGSSTIFVPQTATDMTDDQTILITSRRANNLQYSVGSPSLNSTKIAENWNGVQMTIGVWIESLNFTPGDGLTHYILDNQGTGATTDRIELYIDTAGLLIFDLHDSDGTQHRVQFDATSWTAGSDHQIFARFDLNNNEIELYTDGVSRDAMPDNALSSDTIDAIESTTQLGADTSQANQLNGSMNIIVENRSWSDAEVTADYDSGAGTPRIVTEDTILMDTFADSTTGIRYVHSGKTVSAISNGATESSLTTAAGADGSFADNDRVVVQDAAGFSVEGFVDGIPTDTNVDVDDGAGALVADVEKVGVALDFDGSENVAVSAQIVAAYPFSVAAWIRSDGDGIILSLLDVSDNDVYYEMEVSSGVLAQVARNTMPQVNTGTINVQDGRRHHVAAIFTDATTRIIYVDGVADGTDADNVAYAGGLVDHALIGLLRTVSPTGFFDGVVFEVQVYSITLTAADVLWLATNPNPTEAEIISNTTVAAGETELYHNYRNQDLLDLTSNNNDGTHSGTASFTTSAFISKNIFPDGNMENGGIGGWTAGDAATTISKSAVEIFKDTASLKVLNGDGTQGFARQTITTVTGADYRFFGRFFAPTTANGASQLVDVDATAALGVTVTQAGLSAGWNTVEFAFEAADTSTTIDLGSGSVTNTEFGYWDDVRVEVNMIQNPGMEGGADPPASWTQEASATVTSDATPHSGTNALKVVAGAANVGASQAVTLVSGKYYTVSVWAQATAGDTAEMTIDTGDTTEISAGTVTATSMTKIQATFLSTGTSGVVYLRGVANGDIVFFDDAVMTQLDEADASSV